MASKFLSVFIDNALGENEELLPAFLAGRGGMKEALRFSQNFRIAGIGSLLMSGSPAHFHECLHASARAFAHFARSSPGANLTSRSQPFFDAVACGDTEAARVIARLAPRACDRNREYEEDFLFVRFLMDHCFLDMDWRDGKAQLERYEEVLAGSLDVRLDVCQALAAAADGARFDEALTRMMEARELRFQRLGEKETVAEEVLATEGYVSVEGLALVRLAVSKGLHPQEDFLFIPSVALDEVHLRYRPDSWKHFFT
ncbi:immunity 49 family protein [Corallococcus sp. ZKHCc1 1396]|uniref:Immunity 49 family protein n=1 Tax=Corallococcus soli TaxID=2710757 RepID=A0ABR9PJJ8_9BACT|nr:immunity 49 family protein [Corallococcus soli]